MIILESYYVEGRKSGRADGILTITTLLGKAFIFNEVNSGDADILAVVEKVISCGSYIQAFR